MDEKFITTKDVIKRVGISRSTLFLWIWNNKVPEVKKDRNGHRIFTKEDVDRILSYKNKLILP
ncbi:MAG: helix-turn-helix domain-containing protein [Candidatus Omnitrophica bacterium]|jgi:DNA-binding transcriptional MerR regulator|nr:helix-turn-helix domain-containing protein [Candidatus Omnitrophota bacterium]